MRLYVLRHAKSSWANPGQADFDRPLNERGAKDLYKISAAMRDRKYQPAHIFCSAAARTRQTLAGILAGFTQQPEITYHEGMYHGGIGEYLGLIASRTDNEPVMIIGHNPTCEGLVMHMTAHGNAVALDALAMKFPTGALAVIDFEAESWEEATGQKGYLADFMVPRSLR